MQSREAITCQERPSPRSRRIAAIASARAASSSWRAMANAAAAVGTTTGSALPLDWMTISAPDHRATRCSAPDNANRASASVTNATPSVRF